MIHRNNIESHFDKAVSFLTIIGLSIAMTACGNFAQDKKVSDKVIQPDAEALALLEKASLEIQKTEFVVNEGIYENLEVPIEVVGIDEHALAKKGISIKYNWFKVDEQSPDKSSNSVAISKNLKIERFNQYQAGYYDLKAEFVKDGKTIKTLRLGANRVHARTVDDPLHHMFPNLKGFINQGRTELTFGDEMRNVNLDAQIDLGDTNYDKSKVHILWSPWQFQRFDSEATRELFSKRMDRFIDRLEFSRIFVPHSGTYSISAQIYYGPFQVGKPLLMSVKVNVEDSFRPFELLAINADWSLPLAYIHSDTDQRDFYQNSTRIQDNNPIKLNSRYDYLTFGAVYLYGTAFKDLDMYYRIERNTSIQYIWTDSQGQILSRSDFFTTNTPGKYRVQMIFTSIIDKVILGTKTATFEITNL